MLLFSGKKSEIKLIGCMPFVFLFCVRSPYSEGLLRGNCTQTKNEHVCALFQNYQFCIKIMIQASLSKLSEK